MQTLRMNPGARNLQQLADQVFIDVLWKTNDDECPAKTALLELQKSIDNLQADPVAASNELGLQESLQSTISKVFHLQQSYQDAIRGWKESVQVSAQMKRRVEWLLTELTNYGDSGHEIMHRYQQALDSSDSHSTGLSLAARESSLTITTLDPQFTGPGPML
ncbi:hypothetical protein M407DRAFT_28271 [Tulasnella calospora MUT 4182]|uniref:Uncharacterized protein n=1 Tax=Tulasnella calospora MUT 4182 TaxID=1051891 RepID=A0A0C3QB04_9AGAM|nr:hypothetical protein M407DRAFT_28271 [Tulasnella calospora MUT 4182]